MVLWPFGSSVPPPHVIEGLCLVFTVQQSSQDKFIECQLPVFGLRGWSEEHTEGGLCSCEGRILGGGSAKVLRSDAWGTVCHHGERAGPVFLVLYALG